MDHPYKLVKKIGEGAHGVLYQAVNTNTDQSVAIKLISNPFENEYKGRQVYRELKILNRLSEFQNNVFTPTLYDVILPERSIKTQVNKLDNVQYFNSVQH